MTSRERLQLQGEHVYAVPAAGDGGRSRALPESGTSRPTEVRRSTVGRRALLAPRQPARSRSSWRPRARSSSRRSSFWSACRSGSISSRRGRDADPRQQTLRATIEWSYDLLDESERRLFRGALRLRRAAVDTRPPRPSAMPIRTRSSHCSTRASSAALKGTRAHATGCSRRSASSLQRSSRGGRDRRRPAPSCRVLPRSRPIREPLCRGSRTARVRVRHPRARQHARGAHLGARVG